MKPSRKAAWGALWGLTLPWACAPLLPYPTPEGLSRIQVDQPSLTLQDLQKGRRLYAANCASCHRLHLPSEQTPLGWEKIVPRMGEKGKIDETTCDSILVYLYSMGRRDER
jgi:mono/diheme cytochrome c family protein